MCMYNEIKLQHHVMCMYNKIKLQHLNMYNEIHTTSYKTTSNVYV